MHDWTRVSSGTFRDFHNSWITHIKEQLNEGLLPSPYYAQAEQRAGDIIPDVIALRAVGEASDESQLSWGHNSGSGENGLVAVAEAPPKVQLAQEALDDLAFYLARQRSVVIRHATGDRVVALIEIVSAANRHTRQALDEFADKVIAALHERIHVLVVDPIPPSPNDPDGIHGYIWHHLLAGTYQAPKDQPLTLVSYAADHPLRAYIEPLRVGIPLTPMPLFLTRTHYINVPLQETYQQSWRGVPRRWQEVIEAPA